VGLFNAGFRDARAGTSGKGDRGTRRSAAAVRRRLQQWHRNNAMLYYIYPGFHHKKAMRFVAAAAGHRWQAGGKLVASQVGGVLTNASVSVAGALIPSFL